MARFQVIDRWPRASRLAVLFAVGALLGLIYTFGHHWLTYVKIDTLPNGRRVPRAYDFGLMGIVFVIVPVILVVLSLREQRFGRAALEALSLAGGMVLTYAIRLGDDALNFPYAAISAVFAFACIVFRLGTLLAVRTWICRIVLDHGLLCSSCGYNLTGNISGVCPECGIPIVQSGYHPVARHNF